MNMIKQRRVQAIRDAIALLGEFGITPDTPRYGLYKKEVKTGEFCVATTAGRYEGEISASPYGLTIHCRFDDVVAGSAFLGKGEYKDNDYSSPCPHDVRRALEAFRCRLERYIG